MKTDLSDVLIKLGFNHQFSPAIGNFSELHLYQIQYGSDFFNVWFQDSQYTIIDPYPSQRVFVVASIDDILQYLESHPRYTYNCLYNRLFNLLCA